MILSGYKTYIAAFAAFLTALGFFLERWVNEGIIEPTALITAFMALALLFLRQGIKQGD